jgi:YbbR domain-containing protein
MGFLKEVFIKDWPRKVAAILLACLIYAIVRVQLQDEQTFDNVRITVVSEDSKIVVLNGQDLSASITISGTRRNLGKLKSNQQLEVIKKVGVGTRPGVFEFVLQSEDIKLPKGVVITGAKFTPSQISVIIDQIVEKKVDVRPRIDYDSVPDGWKVKDTPKANPRKILVRGPKSILEGLDRVDTEELRLPKKGTSEKIIREVQLVTPIGVDSVTPSSVEMSVQLNPHLNMISIKVPVWVLKKDNSNYRVANFIDKPEVTVWIKGEKDEIELLQNVHVKAFIEVDESAVGEAMPRVRVWLDRRNRTSCHISDQRPKDITVVVEKIK